MLLIIIKVIISAERPALCVVELPERLLNPALVQKARAALSGLAGSACAAGCRRLPPAAAGCSWLPLAASGCLSLPLAASGCLWLPGRLGHGPAVCSTSRPSLPPTAI